MKKLLPQILLDVSRLLTRLSQGCLPTGVDRVGLAYVNHYADDARVLLCESGFSIVLSQADSAKLFKLLLNPPAHCQWQVRRLVAGSIVRALASPRHVGGVLLHTSHSGLEHERFLLSMRQRGIRTVFMVHDLIPITHPEYCRAGVKATHSRRMNMALHFASGIIANSGQTLDSLQAYASAQGLALPPAVVAHLASGVVNGQVQERLLAMPYFVVLSTIEPRKNHWFLLHVWRRLVELLGDAAPALVVVGRRGWECENVVDMLDRCATLKGRVIEIADCNDQQLYNLLQHAQALLFPSFVEGYGMPLVEALAVGLPVLASDLPVFHEIAGDIPHYLDPLDGPTWMRCIMAYCHVDHPDRQAQLERISSFVAPCWDDHFRIVDEFLEQLP